MATLASSSAKEIPQLIKVELVAEPSINSGVGVSLVTTVEPCWMDLIIDFFAEDRVPANDKEAKKFTEQLLDTDYQLIISCIEDLLTDAAYSVCIATRLKNFWPSYIRKCAVVTWGDVL